MNPQPDALAPRATLAGIARDACAGHRLGGDMNRRWALWLAVIVAPLMIGAAYAQSCGCEVSAAKEREYDRLLRLSAAQKTVALNAHLPFGVPLRRSGAATEIVLVQRDYVIGYDGDLRVPIWTGHRLRRTDLAGQRDRLECFRRDPRLTNQDAAAFCRDYDEPIFDRGHMVPNSDMERSEPAMINTYMFTNMTPQHCAFNRGIWQALESLVRHWAMDSRTLYVITGSVFDANGDARRDASQNVARMRARNGTSRVAVPTHFYKALVRVPDSGMPEPLVIMLPNVNRKIPEAEGRAYLEQHITTVAAVETVTGLDLLPASGLSPAELRAVKTAKASALWSLPASWPRHLDSRCSDN